MEIPPCFHALSDPFKALLALRQSNLAAENFYENYISYWDFNEEWYLQSNPDLNAAIQSQIFPDGHAHYRKVGYFEGRFPIHPDVDENWYLSQYPDVAAAIIKGTFRNGGDHFWQAGYKEGRLPQRPLIDHAWYAKAYLGGASEATPEQSKDHYVSVGYLNGALPRYCAQAAEAPHSARWSRK